MRRRSQGFFPAIVSKIIEKRRTILSASVPRMLGFAPRSRRRRTLFDGHVNAIQTAASLRLCSSWTLLRLEWVQLLALM
jgi:hypothetical protein